MKHLKLLLNASVLYITANVAVSALGFLRNLYFMRSMGHGDLGQIAMLQTIVVVVGFLQLGMINGGYRLYAGADVAMSHRINNTVMTCFLMLTLAVLPTLLFLEYLIKLEISNIETETLLLGFIIGFATLASTWVNNTLIAKGQLRLSSAVNFIAATASLGFVLIPEAIDLHQAFLAFLIQPLGVLVLTLIFHQPSRPLPSADTGLIKEIMALGFAPFCAGVVALINFQVERWFIVSHLGAEAMGAYYLTIVYSAVFTLIPVSLLNLFYPRTVNAYEQKNRSLFLTLTRQHLVVLLSYLLLTIGLTIVFLPLVLSHYLKSFNGLEHLVFYSLPGLVAYSMFDNIALILQSAKKMLNIFLFALLALTFNLLALAWAMHSNSLTLELSAAIKSTSFIAAALIIAIDLFLRREKLLRWN